MAIVKDMEVFSEQFEKRRISRQQSLFNPDAPA
jgi:hypothetical protein